MNYYFYQQLVDFHNQMTQVERFLVRGSWTPFLWVEKYLYVFNGSYNKAEIALTFDDGPDPKFTPAILEKLAKYGVKATFFLLGENTEKWPDIAQRIVAEGHVVANHSYTHPKSSTISLADFQSEIGMSDELLNQLVGYRPRFFRPPYGDINEEQLAWLTSEGMITVQWSVDTNDWRGLAGAEIAKTVGANAYPGSIVLQHNADGVPLQGTVDSLDLFIPQLKDKGVRFVTLPEMFGTTKER